MAGIYFHIPFCKQACHYCDFHFSTSLRYKDDMLRAMQMEMALQSPYLGQQRISTIYFGGGTPSILSPTDIQQLIDAALRHYVLDAAVEITLEANPDDLDTDTVNALRSTPINRFSIGIQSFDEEDLRWMNRAHNAQEAENAIKRVQDAGYENITADLIYGYPLLSQDKWQRNIDKLLAFDIPHISAYSMTVEPQTALAAFIRKGKQQPMDEEQSATQFGYMAETLVTAGYQHYEISNFAKPGRYARHNSNYWKGVPYLGIGPSAHSFDGDTRQWNVSNNAQYTKTLLVGELAYEKETLSEQDKVNEYIMTSLRTMWGLDLKVVEERYNKEYRGVLQSGLRAFLSTGEISMIDQRAILTKKGKLMADHIAAALFF